MLAGYRLVRERLGERLGDEVAPDNAARIMVELLSGRQAEERRE